jgi:hypothetical protein
MTSQSQPERDIGLAMVFLVGGYSVDGTDHLNIHDHMIRHEYIPSIIFIFFINNAWHNLESYIIGIFGMRLLIFMITYIGNLDLHLQVTLFHFNSG